MKNVRALEKRWPKIDANGQKSMLIH